MIRRPPRSPLFPYPPLSRSATARDWQRRRYEAGFGWITGPAEYGGRGLPQVADLVYDSVESEYEVPDTGVLSLDRKSTRLNSSHGYISYAVFCLKKKKVDESSLQPHARTDSELWLSRQILDKQIVDMDGRRVVRFNDLQLNQVDGTMLLVGVDIGGRGRAPRIGLQGMGRRRAPTLGVDWAPKIIPLVAVGPG